MLCIVIWSPAGQRHWWQWRIPVYAQHVLGAVRESLLALKHLWIPRAGLFIKFQGARCFVVFALSKLKLNWLHNNDNGNNIYSDDHTNKVDSRFFTSLFFFIGCWLFGGVRTELWSNKRGWGHGHRSQTWKCHGARMHWESQGSQWKPDALGKRSVLPSRLRWLWDCHRHWWSRNTTKSPISPDLNLWQSPTHGSLTWGLKRTLGVCCYHLGARNHVPLFRMIPISMILLSSARGTSATRHLPVVNKERRCGLGRRFWRFLSLNGSRRFN